MKSMIAFMKKEFLEQIRTSKFIILGILFVLFGVLNPAMAKLTPALMEMLKETMSQSGLIVTEVEVTAMTSYEQFYKNIPMVFIIFVIMQSNIFTKEYQSNTLILALTKGLERYKVVTVKTIVLVSLWTIYYAVYFLITYGYNEYFWDNSIANNLFFSVFIWWVFGIWVILLMVLFSSICNTNTGVISLTGCVVFASYLLSMIPKIKEYLPTTLMDGYSLTKGVTAVEDYIVSIIVAVIIGVVSYVASILMFNKKSL